MYKTLLKIFEGEFVLPKIFVGLVLAIVAWSFIRPVSNQSAVEAEGTPASRTVRSKRLRSKIRKEEYLAQMMEKEKGLRAKYAHKSKPTDQDDQGRHQSRQAWEKDRARTKRFYSKHKNGDTKNPKSVTSQLKKSLKIFDEDRPE